MTNIRKLTFGGLLVTMAILLPQGLHLIGGSAAGKLFLPMHLPVLLGGFLLGPIFGLAIGVLSPLLSFITTGMPDAARLPFMVFELAAYGFFSGFIHEKIKSEFGVKKRGVFISLISAMIFGRGVYAASLVIAAALFKVAGAGVIAMVNATITGIYGIILQIAVIPPIIYILERGGIVDKAFRKS
ncbi:MAG: ECF transporter S component [Eubacterium sp.]|jgi:niacin transporter|nr:ECF transporter S component [Eubacterium sp.]